MNERRTGAQPASRRPASFHSAISATPEAERARLRQQSNAARLRLFEKQGVKPVYAKGRMLRLPFLGGKEWQLVKPRLKQAWIDGQWKGMVECKPASETTASLAQELHLQINSDDSSLQIPDSLKARARRYITEKARQPSYIELGHGALFKREGTNLDADIIRTRHEQFFRKVKTVNADLQRRIEHEQGIRVNANKYLGEGGWGSVRLFEHLSDEGPKLVAGKISKLPEEMASPQENETVSREYALSTHLPKTSFFTSLREFAQVDQRDYFFMDLQVRGDIRKLIEKIQRSNDLTPEEKNIAIRTLAKQSIDAVEQMHEATVFHRDIKPDNLLFSKAGSVVVSDLGLGSRRLKRDSDEGTLDYMPPNPGKGKRANDKKDADKYALGVTLRKYARVANGQDRADLERIATQLTDRDPSKRPELAAVLKTPYLQGATYSNADLLAKIDGTNRRQQTATT